MSGDRFASSCLSRKVIVSLHQKEVVADLPPLLVLTYTYFICAIIGMSYLINMCYTLISKYIQHPHVMQRILDTRIQIEFKTCLVTAV